MIHRFQLHNGKLIDSTTPSVAAGQVGFLAGWGVFSTLRIYDGVPYQWDRHWARMKRDSARLLVPFPGDGGAVRKQMLELIDANQATNAVLRIYVVRNRGGLWEGPGEKPEYDVIGFTANVTPWPATMKLGLVPNARHAASEFAGTKYISWSENLTRYERAHHQGLDEVVLLNERGEVSECTSANIFTVHGSKVSTPSLTAGCLAGVTRAILLEELQVDGIDIRERTLLPADLESADEVFITSTTRELLPVVSVEGLRIRGARQVTDRLQKAFSENVAAYVLAHRQTAHA
ncbi:MAG: aminotransferase class IV [Bryobacteraceae bacterium]